MAKGTANEFHLEKDLQDACVRWARARGWFARRYRAQGRRSAPDYMFIRRSVVVWVEFKLPGEEPTDLQRREHREMMAYGADVVWLDCIEDFRAVLVNREVS